jgi:hypothetical protein
MAPLSEPGLVNPLVAAILDAESGQDTAAALSGV